jgi:hypothetical protein
MSPVQGLRVNKPSIFVKDDAYEKIRGMTFLTDTALEEVF